MKPRRLKDLVFLSEADPELVSMDGRQGIGFSFDCPIHDNCRLAVPFLRPLDGGPPASWLNGKQAWDHFGDLPNITVSPSIHILGGEDSCQWHGFIRGGKFDTCGDSQ